LKTGDRSPASGCGLRSVAWSSHAGIYPVYQAQIDVEKLQMGTVFASRFVGANAGFGNTAQNKAP